MHSGNGDNLLSDINVTPFVDVMLVLLIIFMVTAPMMVQGVNVALPEATADPIPSEEEPLVVSIDKTGQVFISEAPVSMPDLAEKLRRILAGVESQAVVLRADKELPYGTVIGVMAEIKKAGVAKLGMVTVPSDGNGHEEQKT